MDFWQRKVKSSQEVEEAMVRGESNGSYTAGKRTISRCFIYCPMGHSRGT